MPIKTPRGHQETEQGPVDQASLFAADGEAEAASGGSVRGEASPYGPAAGEGSFGSSSDMPAGKDADSQPARKKDPGKLNPMASALGFLNQPVEAVFMRPQAMTLQKQSRKVWLNLLKYAHEQWTKDPTKVWLSESFARLRKDINLSSNDYESLKNSFVEQMSVVVEWGATPGQKGGVIWEAAQLLGPCRIEKDERTGDLTIWWTYPENIRDNLKNFKVWSELDLQILATLSRYPTITMYIMGSRYLTSPGRVTPKLSYEAWYPILTGKATQPGAKEVGAPESSEGAKKTKRKSKVGRDTLPEYRFFKRDTIERGLEELHWKQKDFRLELIEERNRDRTIKGFYFKVVPTASAEPASKESLPELHDKLVRRLVEEMELTERRAEKICADFSYEVVSAAIEKTLQRKNDASLAPLKSIPAYLTSELQSGRADAAMAARPAPAEPPKQSDEAIARARNELLEDYGKAVAAGTRAAWIEATMEQKEELKRVFEKTQLVDVSDTIRNGYNARGLGFKPAEVVFNNWLSKRLYIVEPQAEELLQFSLSRQPSRRVREIDILLKEVSEQPTPRAP